MFSCSSSLLSSKKPSSIIIKNEPRQRGWQGYHQPLRGNRKSSVSSSLSSKQPSCSSSLLSSKKPSKKPSLKYYHQPFYFVVIDDMRALDREHEMQVWSRKMLGLLCNVATYLPPSKLAAGYSQWRQWGNKWRERQLDNNKQIVSIKHRFGQEKGGRVMQQCC